MSRLDVQAAIAFGCEQMAMPLPEIAVQRLAAYVALLERWNRAYNLTAVRRPEDMVIWHILDSLAILPWLRGPRVVDVGSGAGLPGIPLAIARPECAFDLLDSSGKRTRFMTQAVLQLQLRQVQVIRCRVEEYQPAELFDTVLSRAFGSLAALLNSAGRLCAPAGRLLAMKGKRPDEELLKLPEGYKVIEVIRLSVPGLDAERHLIHLTTQVPMTQAEP